MRVAILSESTADEAALRILVDSILGIKTIPVETRLQSRGWHAVKSVLPVITKTLHYGNTADALIVVVDSNHTYLANSMEKNRLRDFQELVQACRKQLASIPGRIPLKIAVGVAAPAIEAWWLCRSHPHVTEMAWEKGLVEKRDPYSKQELKKWLYGSEYFPLQLITRKMTEAAQSLTPYLAHLENSFPNGFGSLANELRSWRSLK